MHSNTKRAARAARLQETRQGRHIANQQLRETSSDVMGQIHVTGVDPSVEVISSKNRVSEQPLLHKDPSGPLDVPNVFATLKLKP